MNPRYLPREHPVRVLLDQVTNGGPLPTRAQLDTYLDRHDLPEGHNLTRFRRSLADAAVEVQKVSRTGHNARAREVAERLFGDMAERMTTEERAIDRTEQDAEGLEDIAARMFR